MDDADASIKRAQEDANTDDDTEDTSTEETDQPVARLATLVNEFGPWTGQGKEEWLIQIPGALFRGVLIKGESVASYCVRRARPWDQRHPLARSS